MKSLELMSNTRARTLSWFERHATILMSAAALIAARAGHAQAPVQLLPETRVRISSPARQLNKVVVVVVAHRGDSLWVKREAGGDTLRLDIRELTQLDISRHRDTHGWAGAGIGLLAGACIGGIAGYAAGDDPPCRCNPNDDLCFSCLNFGPTTAGEKGVAYGIALGATGALVGTFVGLNVKTDRWEPILSSQRVALTSGSRRGAVSIGVKYKIF